MPVGGVGGSQPNSPLDDLRGRAERRRAYEAQQRAEGRQIPGVTGGAPRQRAEAPRPSVAGGTSSRSPAGRASPGFMGGPGIPSGAMDMNPTGFLNYQSVVVPVNVDGLPRAGGDAGRAQRAEYSTAPARAGGAGGPSAPPTAIDPAAQRAAADDLRAAHERRADESVRRGLENNFRIFERGKGVHGRGDGGDAGRAGRADGGGGAGGVVDPANYRYLPSGAIEHESTVRRGQEGARPQDRGAPERARGAKGDGGGGGGAGGAGGAGGGGGAGAAGGAAARPGIDPSTGMISRSRARAAVARAQQMAAGSPQTTGEDLERMNREGNARAQERHEAVEEYHKRYGSHRPILGGYSQNRPSFEEWESTEWQKTRGR